MEIEAGKYYVCSDHVVRKVKKINDRFAYGSDGTGVWSFPNETLSPLTNCKIKIEDEEHYNQVMEMLYESGFMWNSGTPRVYEGSIKCVYLYEKMYITFGGGPHRDLFTQIYFPKQTNTKQKDGVMTKRELNYKALADKVIPYSTKEEWEAIYAALEGIGCNMHSTCKEKWRYWEGFTSSGLEGEIALCYTVLGVNITLQEAIQLLLQPENSKEELEQEKKIAELKETIDKAQKQIQELQNKQ